MQTAAEDKQLVAKDRGCSANQSVGSLASRSMYTAYETGKMCWSDILLISNW